MRMLCKTCYSVLLRLPVGRLLRGGSDFDRDPKGQEARERRVPVKEQKSYNESGEENTSVKEEQLVEEQFV